MVLYSIIKAQEHRKQALAEQNKTRERELIEEKLRAEWGKGFAAGFAQGRAELYADLADKFKLILETYPELRHVLEPLIGSAEISK